jgi:hypothetical protein
MFDNAKRINRPAAPAPVKPGKATDRVAGWEQLAALDATAKALASLVELRKETMETEVLRPEFIARGLASHRKPESMNPAEGDAKGSAYLAKRSTRSILSADDVAVIAEATGVAVVDGQVPGFTKALEKRPAYYAVNPEYAPDGARYDAAKMQKIERLLAKEGITDFVVQYEPEAETVVADEALDNLFKLPAEAIDTVLNIVAGISLRPVFSAGLEKAWELIKPLIPEAVSALASGKAKAKAKAKGNGKAKQAPLKDQLEASLRATAKH